MANGDTVDGNKDCVENLHTAAGRPCYLTMTILFCRYGEGKATFSNGDSYKGMYVNDRREGPGVYKWRDGRVYDGEFKE